MLELDSGLARKIFGAVERSEAGPSLIKTARWSGFRVEESDEEWLRALGPSAFIMSHMIWFYQYHLVLVELENGLTSAQKLVLQYGTLIHDIGEAKINGVGIGDVAAHIKTTDHEKQEAEIAMRILNSLDVEEDVRQNLRLGYSLVIMGNSPLLSHIHKAYEKLEYVSTALNVFRNKGIVNEGRMVRRVLVNDLSKVLDQYSDLGSVNVYLRFMKDVIEGAFDWSSNYSEGDIDNERFLIARGMWESFIQST